MDLSSDCFIHNKHSKRNCVSSSFSSEVYGISIEQGYYHIWKTIECSFEYLSVYLSHMGAAMAQTRQQMHSLIRAFAVLNAQTKNWPLAPLDSCACT